MRIGRRKDNDIVLPLDQRISRTHARLQQRGGHWYIEDLGSANGTFVNDRRVHGPVQLRPGDQVRVGRTWLQVVPHPLSAAERQAAQAVRLSDESAPVPAENIVLQVAAAGPPPLADAQTLHRRLQTLVQVAEALGSTLDLDELLGRVLDYVLEVVPAQRGVIVLRDERGELKPRVLRQRDGGRSEEVTLSRHLVEQALQESSTILTEDALSDERFRDASSIHELRIRSAICAPLIHRGQPLGVIYLDTTSDTEIFGPDTVELLNSIAPQAAAAIANARLYTELRNAYQELRQTQQQMVQTEKLSSIGTLAASLAHDMGNIVAAMSLLTQRLERQGQLGEEDRELLGRQVQRLNTLLRRVLSLARGRPSEKQPADVNEIVAAVGSLVATEARHRGLELKLELSENLPQVYGDASQLEQAVLNLVLNALEACAAGNQVVLATGQDGGDVVITVTDDGPGIPEDVQAHLFEPFYTTKDQGTGLGLFSTRRIVQEEHGGLVEVDSRPGEGTTVTIRLPALAPTGPNAEEAECQAS
jgi:signal transduction histidine kinase